MSDVAGGRRLHYAWIVAAASFVTLLGSAGRSVFVVAGVCCLVAAAGVMRIRTDRVGETETAPEVALAPT